MSNSGTSVIQGPPSKRFGCIAARIGTSHILKLKVDYISGSRAGEMPKMFRKGTNIQLGVEDITRHPDLRSQAKWYCHFCRDEWDTKEELIAAHPENRILAKQQETHLYYAYVQRNASPGKPAKLEGGKVIADAVEAQEAMCMLFSDEE
jgi:hypothetical protein